MKKLTKEQRDMILQDIISSGYGENPDGGYYVLNIKNIEVILNKHTKKECPIFKIDCPTGRIGISQTRENIEISFLGIFEPPASAINMYLPKNDFKEFVNGINRISQYLEEQEKELDE